MALQQGHSPLKSRLSVHGKDTVFWDRDLPGFGVRVYPSGRKVYVVQSRAGGKSRRATVGRHGAIAPDRARKEAARLIARIKAGQPLADAAPEAPPTVADLAGRYLREHVAVHCKPNTVKHYGLMVRKHIVPGLGDLRVSEARRKHILEFHYGLSDVPTVANRCVDILVKMFNLAEPWEMRPPGRNPCRSVRRYKVNGRKERFLTPQELARLGRTLDIAPAERLASRHAAADVLKDLPRVAALQYSLHETRFMANKVVDMLSRLFNMAEQWGCAPEGGNPWVITGTRPGQRFANLNGAWLAVRARVGLNDLLHSPAIR